MQGLLDRIIARLMETLTRRGYLIQEQGMTYLADIDADNPLRSLRAAACAYRIALGPRAGQYFDPNGSSLGAFFADTFGNGLSFLGVSFSTELISRVRITTGNSSLGPNDESGVDVVPWTTSSTRT